MATLGRALAEVTSAAEPLILDVVPRDGSPAMAELAGEAPFRAPGWETPLMNAATSSMFLAAAAVDATRGVAGLLSTNLLVWAPIHLARAALDAAGYAYWLDEPHIGTEARAKRSLAFRMFSASGLARAPTAVTAAKDKSSEVADSVREVAAQLGWTVISRNQQRKNQPVFVDDQAVPHRRDAIHNVLAHQQPDRYDSAADITWWWYSNIAHSSPWALMQFVDRSAAEPLGVPGVTSAPLMIDGHQLLIAAAHAGFGVIGAASVHADLLGLDPSGLDQAAHGFRVTLGELNKALGRH